jgi:hypothetical protein
MMPSAADWHDGQIRVCRGFSDEHARHYGQAFPKASAICRKSYVHDTIVTAFEDGILERFAATIHPAIEICSLGCTPDVASAGEHAMSAPPNKADVKYGRRQVRKVPKSRHILCLDTNR